ncbi:hypothetical protein QUC31_008190 [Theobroma cacao]
MMITPLRNPQTIPPRSQVSPTIITELKGKTQATSLLTARRRRFSQRREGTHLLDTCLETSNAASSQIIIPLYILMRIQFGCDLRFLQIRAQQQVLQSVFLFSKIVNFGVCV